MAQSPRGSQFISSNISEDHAIPNETITIQITYKNNGPYDEYNRSSWFKRWYNMGDWLLPANNDARLFLGNTSCDLTVDSVNINQSYTFTISLLVPQNIEPREYMLAFRMHHRGVDWDEYNTMYYYEFDYGDICTIQMQVLTGPNSELISYQFLDSIDVAKRGTALITLKNTGIWTWNREFRIECNSADSYLFSRAYYYVPILTEIPTSGEFTFRIPIRAPPTTGTYQICFRLWWYRCGKFGTNACKNVVVTMPSSPVEDLNDYNWQNLTCRRTTADIAWQYTITLDGSERPPDFGRLYHEIDGICALHGELAEFSVDCDYPAISTVLTAYSFGYFLNNYLPVKIPDTNIFLRQSRVGSDIKNWQKADSFITAIQSKTEEIKTYENPSHYLARILFYVDDATGKIDATRAGPYGLWATDALSSVEELAVTGGIPTFRPVPNWGIGDFTGSDGKQYLMQTDAPVGVTLTHNEAFNHMHPTSENPQIIENKQFSYDTAKISEILEDLSEHCHMLFYTRFIKVDGLWREYLYWIPKYGVALQWLGVDQTPLQITPETIGLIGSPGLSASISLEKSYNAVWVEACRKKDSAWFYAYRPGAGVISGTESPRTLIYRSHDLLPDPTGNKFPDGITVDSNFGPGGMTYGTETESAECQAIVERKAVSLLDLLEYQIPTYSCTFENLFFELYQVLVFSEFSGLDSFNGFEMQIIDIEYNFNPPDEGGHEVTITCAPKMDMQASGKFQSVVDEIRENFEKLKESIDSGETDDKLGIIISTYSEGTMCNAQLRSSGMMYKTRAYGYRTSTG